MTFRTILISVLLMGLAFMGCKKAKDSQFIVKEQTDQMSNQQLPPGHPPIDPNAPPPAASGQAMPSGQAIPPPPAAPNEGGIDLNKLEKALPGGWKKVPPSSNMRIAQYKLPKTSTDPDEAECYVFYLGMQGGTVDANIERWFGQFSDQKDKNTSKSTSAGKLNITFAEVSGKMVANAMMGGSQTEKPQYRLFGAIVETAAGPYFFKAIGPDKSIKAQREAIKSWISKAVPANSEAIGMH